MLRHLAIRDFVIVDRLELEFQNGFGALTGETGAGKSILLDALGLTLGDRADGAVVRAGKERAELSAEFDVPGGEAVSAWLREQGFEPEPGEGLVLRRVIDAGGRSRAWINGASATLGQLRELAGWLADIHGQHAHYALLRAEAQLALLDAHAGLQGRAKEVAALFRVWQQARQACQAAQSDLAQSERERELLEWQVKELREAAFSRDEWVELNAEQQRLAHGASLMEGADEALEGLGEGEFAAVAQLERLSARLAELAAHDEALAPIGELLQGAAIQADEVLHELRRYRDRLDLDPARLQELDTRIGQINDLARKYRVAVEDLPELLAESEGRLGMLIARCDPAELERQETAALAAYRAAAESLSAARAPAAAALSEAVSAVMQDLAMSGGVFEVALVAHPEGSANGLESVEFRVAANRGQEPRPMAKVASGGEISRIGLAIQVITSRSGSAPTLIFDEVDVGIGGRVAEIVGRLLRQLGDERQVLCVTHLPQVAAQANWQWRIAKAQRAEDTVSDVWELDPEGRIEEIARMLGGVDITDTTRRHAAEMLGLA